MAYKIEFKRCAREDLAFHRKVGDKAVLQKLRALIKELADHPTTGTGKPELMRNNFSGCWSRRINHKHRLVYSIHEEVVTVMVLSCRGHYDDK